MKIDRTSWHYRHIYHWCGCKEKKNESLCSYFWKVVGALFFCIVFAPIGLLVFGTMLGIIFGLGWFFGYWPNIGKYADKANDDMFHKEYKYDGRKHRRFAPWGIVLPLATIAGIVYWAVKSLLTLLLTAMWIGIILGSTAAIIGIIFVLVKGWRSETFKLIRAYISARKRKICPLIQFEGELPGKK